MLAVESASAPRIVEVGAVYAKRESGTTGGNSVLTSGSASLCGQRLVAESAENLAGEAPGITTHSEQRLPPSQAQRPALYLLLFTI